MNTFQVYKDIKKRTNGEIYIGVVGPVRTGKSTFIKRFMEVLVLPGMVDEHIKLRTQDELPQSASGKTIMTTEPKFIPKEAAEINLADDVSVKIRLIDCVGYMVDGVVGHMEGNEERQVKTPWFAHEIPFTKAAGIGTKKVIHDHSSVGIVVTTDGTVCGLERKKYEDAERKTIKELQGIGKPFVVLVNSRKPYGEDAKKVVKEIEETYEVQAIPVNCEQLKEEDIYKILEALLLAFPVAEIQFMIPKWVEMLSREHEVKKDILNNIRELLEAIQCLEDAKKQLQPPQSQYIKSWRIDTISPDTGCIKIIIEVDDRYYYEILSELTGVKIENQYALISTIKDLSVLKEEYQGVKDAFSSVRACGYGVVTPKKEEIILDEPEVIRQGNRYGVKIHSKAPSIHLIRADIETEIAPIVGNEQQAKDLIQYIRNTSESENGIWGTNIFGKSIEELILDGMRNKVMMINEECQGKLQDTMQKIVNDSSGGMVCIII